MELIHYRDDGTPLSVQELRELLRVVEDALDWEPEDGSLVRLSARLHGLLVRAQAAARGPKE